MVKMKLLDGVVVRVHGNSKGYNGDIQVVILVIVLFLIEM